MKTNRQYDLRQRLAEKQPLLLDTAAAAVCLCLFAYLFYAAAWGVGSIDENFYYTIPYRQLLGDRLLIEEWHVTQLSSVLQLFPYWLVTTLAGSTEGVVLHLRWVCLTVDLILYWFLYARLRRYGWAGLLATVLFCANVPMSIMTLNYYTMSGHGLTVVCLLLFTGRERKNAPTLLLTGVVMACTVLAEPFLAAVYLVWCLLVLLREAAKRKGGRLLENYGFILNPRSWLWVTVGIVLTAAAFFAYLLSRATVPEIIKEIPELFTDYEYAMGDEGKKLLDVGKIMECFRFYGYLPPVGLIAVAVLGFVSAKKERLRKWKPCLFLLAVLFLLAAYVTAFILMPQFSIRAYGPIGAYFFYFHGVPLMFFGWACYSLREKKDPRVFAFLAVGFLASLMIDLASDLVMGIGISIMFTPIILSLQTVLAELRDGQPAAAALPAEPEEKAKAGQKAAAKTNKKAKGKATPKKKEKIAVPDRFRLICRRFPRSIVALSLCVVLSWECYGLYAQVGKNVVEQLLDLYKQRPPLSAVIDRGPLKGLRTTEHVNSAYQDILTDLDVIKENCRGPVYVTELLSYCYLYMGLPIGTYTTWYVEEDSEVRQTRYWELHPEKRPDYIYVPFYDAYYYQHYRDRRNKETWGEEKLAFLQTVCDCEVTEGKAGYILRVNKWLI